jgi:hypothetical protein
MIHKSEHRVISILGMHRSGTSCLTGSLEEAGVYLGNVQRKNPYNLKGNCEHLKIMELHEDLFATNGGSWDNPPDNVKWLDKHRKLRDEIIREYETIPFWGFKDPRVLFALDGWMEVLPDISLIGTFRYPLATARSLERRNQFPLEKGFQIWLAYNTKLLEYYDKKAFPIISFDVDEDVYKHKLTELLPLLGLTAPQESFNFFAAELRNVVDKSYQLPGNVQNLYDRLQKVAR